MSTENKIEFWIVCCEDNAVTQKVAQAVDAWQLPGVRSLILRHFADAECIAKSEYAIFITSDPQPHAQIKISPLNLVQPCSESEATVKAPDQQLIALHERYGQSPQSWWFQLPTTELRAQKVQPVSPEKSVAQSLAQVEIFVRNYTREMSFTPFSAQPSSAQPSSAQPSSAQSTKATATPDAPSAEADKQPVTATKAAQPAKRKVVLSHYRRL